MINEEKFKQFLQRRIDDMSLDINYSEFQNETDRRFFQGKVAMAGQILDYIRGGNAFFMEPDANTNANLSVSKQMIEHFRANLGEIRKGYDPTQPRGLTNVCCNRWADMMPCECPHV